MAERASGGLLRSMVVMGSANVANILISVVRLKALALMLGPAGVGLLGIYSNLLGTASTVAGLGLASSGVRQIAGVRGEDSALSRVRLVLFGAHVIQGSLAMALVWFSRAELARLLFGDEARATEVGLIGVAALLALLASSQTALLRGMRRIADLGRVTVIGALGGTSAGLIAVWIVGEDGLIWFVLIQPLAAVAAAAYYTRRLPRPSLARLPWSEAWRLWRPMAALGAVFMLSGLATMVTLLVVRGMITNELGLAGAGLFAAAWGITIQYVGVLLSAMAADYYPRLTEVISDKILAARLVNDQTQLGLLLGGPVLLLLIGLAPWVMTAFYSIEFKPAAEMLQWQTVGNIFKLASWPISFVLVAAAMSKTYLLIELSWNAFFVLLIWIGLPAFGLEVAGTAFLMAYVLYLSIVYFVISRSHGFQWTAFSLQLVFIYALLGFAVLAVAKVDPYFGAAVGLCLSAATSVIGMRFVVSLIGSKGRVATRVTRAFASIGWPIKEKK